MAPPATDGVEEVSRTKAFECDVLRFQHTSSSLGGLRANFSVIVPQSSSPLPVLFWLSGLTCTDENFVIKAGAARAAAANQVAIVCPDTSPRGAGAVAEDDSWDFGTGAGFYVDATTEPYKTHYNMSAYILEDLPRALREAMPARVDLSRASIFGHSMGGMGALSLSLRNPKSFVSVSALAPICHPVACAFGEKCFSGYLGDDREAWKAYDPTELMRGRDGPLFDSPVLIHQGSQDSFLETQLKLEDFVAACKAVGQKVYFLSIVLTL